MFGEGKLRRLEFCLVTTERVRVLAVSMKLDERERAGGERTIKQGRQRRKRRGKKVYEEMH